MPTQTIIDCRVCQGKRQTTPDGKLCGGCGTPVANAVHKPKKRATNYKRKCPACSSIRTREIEPQRFMCDTCGGVFEEDFEPLHNRPEINLEKKAKGRRR